MAPSFPLTPGNSLDRSASAPPPIPPRPSKLHQSSTTLPPTANLIDCTPTPLPRSLGPVPTVLPVPPPADADPTFPSISSFNFDPPTAYDVSYPVSSTPLPASLRPPAIPAPAPVPAHSYAQTAPTYPYDAPQPAPTFAPAPMVHYVQQAAPPITHGPPPLAGVSFAGLDGEDVKKFLDQVETAIEGNIYFHQLPREWATRWVRMHTSGTAKKWMDRHCHLSWEECRAQFRARFVVEKSPRELWEEWRAVRHTGRVAAYNQAFRLAAEEADFGLDSNVMHAEWASRMKPALLALLESDMRARAVAGYPVVSFDDKVALVEQIEISNAHQFVSPAPATGRSSSHPLHLHALFTALPPLSPAPANPTLLAQALALPSWVNQGSRPPPPSRRAEAIPAPPWGDGHRPPHLPSLERFIRTEWALCGYCRDPDHEVDACPKARAKDAGDRCEPRRTSLSSPAVQADTAPAAECSQLCISAASVSVSAPVIGHTTLQVQVGGPTLTSPPLPALIDSGATGCFISDALVDHFQLPLTPLAQPRALKVIDGRPIASGAVTHTAAVVLTSSHHTERLDLFVCALGHYDLVLGTTWLHAHNPDINWVDRIVGLFRAKSSSPIVVPTSISSSPSLPPTPPTPPCPPPASSIAPPTVEVLDALAFHDLVQDEQAEVFALHFDAADGTPLHLSSLEAAVDGDLQLADTVPIPTEPYLSTVLPSIPTAYHDLAPVFSKAATDELPPHRPGLDVNIELKEASDESRSPRSS